MAPPIPLASVAGTLALSFTAGRAAPAPASSPEAPTSVPAPPRLPPVPGETETTAPSETATPETATAETTPETATPEPPLPEPPTVEPVSRPRVSTEVAIDDEDAPGLDEPPAERLLRPNTKKLMFNLFVGGSKALRGGYSYFGGSDFKTELAIGGFDRRFRVGGSAVVQISSGFPLSTFTLAPRLSLNRQIVPDHAIYLTTNVTLGYRSTTYGGYGVLLGLVSGAAFHSAVVGASWGVSAVVGERLLLSFRPLDLELVAPYPTVVQINWSAMGGIGIVWGDRDD